ncbi:MAG TPA: Rrf2 family transcriptional regulator [Brumimicrobium sp.]|nr:Rrf2 family transcriptional regulator [Brumimicrobium sp.]
MISSKCKYAIRAVIYLATKDAEKERLGGTQIAEALDLPLAFTNKILQELSRKNVIDSFKGPKGGFILSEYQKSNSILFIIEAIDGLSIFFRCGMGLDHCSDIQPCPFHSTFKKVREDLLSTFKNQIISDFKADDIDVTFFLSNTTRNH